MDDIINEKLSYFPENEEFGFSCLTKEGGIQVVTFDKNLDDIDSPTNELYIFNV